MDLRSELIKEIQILEKYAKEYEDDIPNLPDRRQYFNKGKSDAYKYAANRLKNLLDFFELPEP